MSALASEMGITDATDKLEILPQGGASAEMTEHGQPEQTKQGKKETKKKVESPL